MERYGYVARFWSEKLMTRATHYTILVWGWLRGEFKAGLSYIFPYPYMTPLKKLIIKIPQGI